MAIAPCRRGGKAAARLNPTTAIGRRSFRNDAAIIMDKEMDCHEKAHEPEDGLTRS